MRFMVLVPSSPDSEAGEMPSTELLEAMTRYNEELAKAGVMVGGDGLLPTSAGARIRFECDQRTVTDGPFTEAKEVVAGYWLWEFASLEDFEEAMTPELREAHERLGEQIEGS